jgi:mono/diheme cytochrome c family protein
MASRKKSSTSARSRGRPGTGANGQYFRYSRGKSILNGFSARGSAIVVFIGISASLAFAADVDRGQRLAEQHCSACHAMGPKPSNVVADSPPFSSIARKHRFDATTIGFAILAPHPKMNFTPSPVDADDIAAYISALQ